MDICTLGHATDLRELLGEEEFGRIAATSKVHSRWVENLARFREERKQRLREVERMQREDSTSTWTLTTDLREAMLAVGRRYEKNEGVNREIAREAARQVEICWAQHIRQICWINASRTVYTLAPVVTFADQLRRDNLMWIRRQRENLVAQFGA